MSVPFGPFCDLVDPVERIAQLRSLRTLVRCHFGLPELERALREAETDCGRLIPALALFDAVPPLKRRKILSTFAYLHQPAGRKASPESPRDSGKAFGYTRRRKGTTEDIMS